MVSYFTLTARYILCATLILTTLTGQAADTQDDMILVDIDWLSKHLHDDNLVIVDARTENEYLKEHIPTAINIPVMKTFNPVNPKDRVANLQYIKKLFRQAGIQKQQTIVVYDNNEYMNAGRVFWVFEVYGHKNVKLLNGGLTLWKNKKFPTSNVAVKVTPSDYVPMIEPERLITRLDMRLAIEDDNKLIIDARTLEEYTGKQSKSSRFGHIPGATSVPFEENFDIVDGIRMLKPVNELKKMYGSIARNKKVYTYCNKGKHSSLTYALLRQLGYDAAHYDGSWYEWGNDSTLPIEQPQASQQKN